LVIFSPLAGRPAAVEWNFAPWGKGEGRPAPDSEEHPPPFMWTTSGNSSELFGVVGAGLRSGTMFGFRHGSPEIKWVRFPA
jgi:hypothetical protein